MPRHRRILTLAFAASLGLVPMQAAAQPSRPDPSAEDKATARALMDEGDALVKKNDLASALEKFKAADLIMGVPTTGLSLGETQARLRLLVEAADTFARVQRYPIRRDEPKPFSVARERAAQRLAEIAPRIPSVTIQVAPSEPLESIRVSIDGRELSPASRFVPRRLNPGRHEAVIDSGDRRGTASFDLLEGDARTLSVLLSPTGLPRGSFVGAAGASSVEGSGNQGGSSGDPGSSGDRSTRTSAATLDSLMWIGTGVAGVGLLVGAITGGLAVSAQSTLEEKCPGGACTTSDARSEYDRAYALAHTSTVSLVLAGLGAGTAATGWYLGRTARDDDSKNAIVPIIGPGFVGLRGSF